VDEDGEEENEARPHGGQLDGSGARMDAGS
jgi:hypothetical protein